MDIFFSFKPWQAVETHFLNERYIQIFRRKFFIFYSFVGTMSIFEWNKFVDLSVDEALKYLEERFGK